jgi:hypothetical protein
MEQKEKLELVIEQLEERIAPGGVDVKFNSGGGNGSEIDPATGLDGDPGNSGGNKGKD